MTAKADPTAQIAELRRTLAEATKECPQSGKFGHESYCVSGCNLTGLVARFPGFRQECPSIPDTMKLGGIDYPHNPHCICHGTGWQVRAGGLEDALASLTLAEASTVFVKMFVPESGQPWNPMPSADELLVLVLKLVIEVAGL